MHGERQHTLERVNVDERDEGVVALSSLLILVALALAANADTERNVGNAAGPDELVQGGVDTDILGAHLLDSESLDLLKSAGGTLLGAAVNVQVKMGKNEMQAMS